MQDKYLIDIISKCYLWHKRLIKENELGITVTNAERLKVSKGIVEKIEKTASFLTDEDYFIIYNEVIKGKEGHWYMGYLSDATYYRHRRVAYQTFINYLNK